MEVLHQDDRENTRKFWADSVAGHGPYDVEYRVRGRDGGYGWLKTRGTPIRDSEGRIIKWFGTCTDITDRKRAEEALYHSEQALRRARDELEVKVVERTAELQRSETYLAEAQKLTRSGSWAWNAQTKQVTHWSEEQYRMLGFDPQAGMPSDPAILARIHPGDQARYIDDLKTAMAGGKDPETHYRVCLPDFTLKYVHVVGH